MYKIWLETMKADKDNTRHSGTLSALLVNCVYYINEWSLKDESKYLQHALVCTFHTGHSLRPKYHCRKRDSGRTRGERGGAGGSDRGGFWESLTTLVCSQ